MLAQRGFSPIHVYDRLVEPSCPATPVALSDLHSARSYNIGINGRGQSSLRNIGVMNRVEQFATAVIGRKDWNPGMKEPVEKIYADERSYRTRVLQRDTLTSCILQEVLENYKDQIQVTFNTECKGLMKERSPNELD